MIQDLIILGLLSSGPKHGYQIKKLIKEITAKYASIENTSIYYPLRRMKKEGLLSEKRIKQERKGLEKFVYTITKKGGVTFKKLLYKNFLRLERPFINTDISLYFMKYMDKNMARRRLKQRRNWLMRIRRWLKDTESNLKKNKNNRPLILIIKHNMLLIRAEINFSDYLLKNLSV